MDILITLVLVLLGLFLVHVAEWAGKKDAKGGIGGLFTLAICFIMFVLIVKELV